MGGKHKKTRRQKILADLNRQTYSLENKNISSLEDITPTININNNVRSYSYVLHDVSKTLIITLSLIGLQILLFFLLKNHTIVLPKIGY